MPHFDRVKWLEMMPRQIYLDNCCFNRPFDDQSQPRIRLESEAKLFIQDAIRDGRLQLAWSYILDFENNANPLSERREAIQAWRAQSVVDTEESAEIISKAESLAALGLRSKDALHVACAIEMSCRYFVTTDDRLLKRLRGFDEIMVVDPTTFVREVEF